MSLACIQLVIRFGYDGARFHGVQPQAGLATAGGALLQRVRDAFASDAIYAVAFAARTDAGVHADANWASCRVPGGGLVSVDAALAKIGAARDDGLGNVHALAHWKRTSARAIATHKHYRYTIETPCDAPATDKSGAWTVVPALDVAPMRLAAQALVGTYDFSGYACRKATGSRVKTVQSIAIERVGSRVIIDVHGSGFLRYMIRYMVGHLAAIGAGLEHPCATARRLASKTLPTRLLRAPADGLRLVHVTVNLNQATPLRTDV